MSTNLKLRCVPDFYRSQKILVAAALAGVVLDVPSFAFGVDNKTDEFKRIGPMGKVPVLETPQGALFESNAILRYIARIRPEAGLYGAESDALAQALVDQWLDFTQNEIEPYLTMWLHPIAGLRPFNAKSYAEAKQKISLSLSVLNNHLLNHTYLVGNTVTIADLAVAATLAPLYKSVFSPEFIAPFGNTTRWFLNIVNQPEFIAVGGKIELAKAEMLAAGATTEAKAKENEKKTMDSEGTKQEAGAKKAKEKEETVK